MDMKTLVIYFSQTGNTQEIAKCIAEGISNVTGQCDKVNLNGVDVKLLANYDLIGIGSPVFYYKEPFNVRDFIESLFDLKGQHWFVFCTHGNVIGNFFPSMNDLLKKKGAIVIGFFNSYANITVPFYPSYSYTSGHPDEHDFNAARSFGEKIALRSPKIINQKSPLIPIPGPVSSEEWIKDAEIITPEYLDQVSPKLTIDGDKCSLCHTCEESCPVQGIDIEMEPPRIQQPCIYCWRCVNVCPTLAISANWDSIVSLAPSYYERYRKELDKAAERGEFRWLVDPETVDPINPFYKQREKEAQKNK